VSGYVSVQHRRHTAYPEAVVASVPSSNRGSGHLTRPTDVSLKSNGVTGEVVGRWGGMFDNERWCGVAKGTDRGTL
jgi:hypothetical protein